MCNDFLISSIYTAAFECPRLQRLTPQRGKTEKWRRVKKKRGGCQLITSPGSHLNQGGRGLQQWRGVVQIIAGHLCVCTSMIRTSNQNTDLQYLEDIVLNAYLGSCKLHASCSKIKYTAVCLGWGAATVLNWNWLKLTAIYCQRLSLQAFNRLQSSKIIASARAIVV